MTALEQALHSPEAVWIAEAAVMVAKLGLAVGIVIAIAWMVIVCFGMVIGLAEELDDKLAGLFKSKGRKI